MNYFQLEVDSDVDLHLSHTSFTSDQPQEDAPSGFNSIAGTQVIHHCSFRGLRNAVSKGSGLDITDTLGATITNCEFDSVSGTGSALSVSPTYSPGNATVVIFLANLTSTNSLPGLFYDYSAVGAYINNVTAVGGAGVYAAGVLALDDVYVADCTGPAVYITDASLTVANINIDGVFSPNSASGFYVEGATLSITNSSVRGATTGATGAGVFAASATLTVTNTVIADCASTGDGGGVVCSGSSAECTFTNVTVSSCTGISGAGAMAIQGAENVTITSSTFVDNR